MRRRTGWFLGVVVVLAAGVAGGAAVAGVAFWHTGEWDPARAVASGVAIVVSGVVGAVIVGAIMGRRISRAVRDGGPYEVALRLADGTSDVAGARWIQAAVEVRGRSLHVVRLVGGLRFWRRPPVAVEVLAVRETDRRTPARSALRVTPGMTVVELTVPGGTLELATVGPMAEQLLARLAAAEERLS
jgi:hypothetical protein